MISKAYEAFRQLKARKLDDLNKTLNNPSKDGGNARLFKLVGGRWHNKTIRMYAPFDDIKLTDGSTYSLHPPVDEGDPWVYLHTGEDDG